MADVPEQWQRLGAAALGVHLPEVYTWDDEDGEFVPVDLGSLALTVLEPVLSDMRRYLRRKRDWADGNTGSRWLFDDHRAGQAHAYDDVLDLLDTGDVDA